MTTKSSVTLHLSVDVLSALDKMATKEKRKLSPIADRLLREALSLEPLS